MGDSNSRSRPPQQANTGLAWAPVVRPRHASLTRLGHSPNHWWLVTELNRVHRLFRPALYRRVSRAKLLVDGARLELASHGRESNSRNWSHNPAPKPFGQSRHQTWSWSSESNTRRRGTSSLHCHCARPAKLWSWHAASNCGRALTMRLLFPLSYTSGAGAAIRTPITDLRGPRSSH